MTGNTGLLLAGAGPTGEVLPLCVSDPNALLFEQTRDCLTSEDGWHALATFANIPRGSTANLEGEPSALIYRYALYRKQLLAWEDLRLRRVGAFDP
jgi:hypothetical protein